MTTARRGVWTPWATVWCLACDYAAEDKRKAAGTHVERRPGHRRVADPTELVHEDDDGNIGRCDECAAACWVRSDVALVQRIGYKLSDLDWDGNFGWALQQTGGMCCALVVNTAHNQIVVTAMDGTICVGEYVDDEWCDALRMEEFPLDADIAVACQTILSWVREPAVAA